MKITFTKAEAESIIRQGLLDYHKDLLKNAGLSDGYTADGFEIKISTYKNDEFLEVTGKLPEDPFTNEPINQELGE